MSFNNLGMNGKVASLLFSLLVLSLFGACYASMQMLAITDMYSEILDRESKAVRQNARVNVNVVGVKAAMYRNLTATNESGKKDAEKDRATYVERANTAFTESQKLTSRFGKQIGELHQKFQQVLAGACGDALKSANDFNAPGGSEAATKLMNESCGPELDKVTSGVRALNDSIVTFVDKASDDAAAFAKSTAALTLAGIVGAGLLIMGLAIYLTRVSIVKPLQTLTVAMVEMGKGHLDVTVTGADRKDEIGAMAKSLEGFRSQLSEVERMRRDQAEQDKKASERRRAERRELADRFQQAVGTIVDTVSGTSTHLESAAVTLNRTAGNTQELSTVVATASEQTSVNVQGVATASEQLSSTVSEIGRQVQESSSIAEKAVSQAAATNEQVAQLAEAANRIGDVVSLINSIAGQTNLLALNATIEAARAGDAGKGFAVVAQEVKALAAQTAKATSEIGAQIASMQAATGQAVDAIHEIATTIARMSEISGAIAAAVEEQDATTKEISRNVLEAAKGTSEVANSITNVSNGASETGAASSQVLSSAQHLAHESASLRRELENFLTAMRAA